MALSNNRYTVFGEAEANTKAAQLHALGYAAVIASSQKLTMQLDALNQNLQRPEFEPSQSYGI